MKKKIIYGVAALIIFAVGFASGTEYKAYQVRTAFEDAFSGETTNIPTEEASAETVMQKAENENMATIQKAIGDEIALSSLTFTVTSAEEKQVISDSYSTPKTAKEGSKFVVVGMDVTNTTQSQFTLYPDDGFLLVDDKGREYTTYEDTIGGIDNYLNVRELSPSIKETGFIVYEIPTDATKYDLVTSKAGSKELYKVSLK